MPDTFLYFAYGSNMFTRRLAARTPSAVRITTAFVEGRRLAFDKVSTDGSGKCDIEATWNPADRVYGVLFRIATAEERALDEAEGVGHGYRKDEITVVTFEGTAAATAYFATEKDPKRRPYDWYKAFVLQGATENALPAVYIDLIRAVPSQPIPIQLVARGTKLYWRAFLSKLRRRWSFVQQRQQSWIPTNRL